MIPKGLKIVNINNELAQEIGVDLSLCDFDKLHFGKCLMSGDNILSYCYSIFLSHDEAEIDVKTIESDRLNGYATLVVKEFINECIDRGIKPNWACWPYNESSIKLALKVGFKEDGFAKAHFSW